ncbi:MAG: TolC family protein [Gammaproteobacteria bacterium]|nr:TolC family protein [Gammaproteobacteria bacterium]MDH5617497.1 TolC family protein [Gammaproteobacteria bacterium]
MSDHHGRAPAYIAVFVVMASLPWPSIVAAQQRVPLTIAEAEDLALAGEPGQMALLAQSGATREQAVAAGALPDPVLRVGLANYPVSGGGFSAEGMTQAQLGLRQSFPRGRAQGAEQLRARADAMSESASARGRDVLAAARIAWLDAYYAQQALDLVSESRPFFADLVSVTRSMYAVGRKTQHDVLRAELELSRLDVRLMETKQARAEAQAALSRWLGQDAYRPLAMKLPAWDALPSLEDLRAGLEEHPAISAASAEISAREAAVRIAEEQKKPGWALDVGYGYRDGFLPDGSSRSDFVSLSVSVDLPFFSENRQDRKLAAALGNRSAALQSRAELLARLRSELDIEYARWTDLSRRLELYESQILGQSADQAQAALLAYQSDTGDFADVMRGYIDDLNTRLERIRLQVKRLQSYATLANLGGMEQ